MPVAGDLNTIPLPDLLQWISISKKNGVLELERDQLHRRIEFRQGQVSGCSSDDPQSRLGQFLIARGRITEENLCKVLAQQEQTGRAIGLILLDLGILKRAELAKLIAVKAEETIQGMFAWDDAAFRFDEGATLNPDQIDAAVSVETILLKGLQYQDELKQFRELFETSGVVLERTDASPGPEITDKPVARRIYELIDGERSLAEITLHARASEFLSIKLLYKLHQRGLLRIREARPADPERRTILDPIQPLGREDVPGEGRQKVLDSFERLEKIDRRKASDGDATAGSLLDEIEVAQRLMARGELSAALELLNASHRAYPGDTYLRELISKAEAAFIEKAQSRELRSDRVPVVVEKGDVSGLSAGDSFLLSLVDGRSDIKSLVWTSPLREVDLLIGLQRLADRQLIALNNPAAPALA